MIRVFSEYCRRLISRDVRGLILVVAALPILTACGYDADWELGEGGDGEVELAADGEAKMPIVIGEDPDPSLEVAADELADYLQEISGASFEVERGHGERGIVLGTPDDFGALPMADVEFGDGPFDMEDYVIRSADDGLYLLGSTPLATRFAVWDLLYRLGHRQFFPTETWEVVPQLDDIAISADIVERPDYYSRQAPRGAMRMDRRPWAQQPWHDWQVRNRATPTFSLKTGHVYDHVISENGDDFQAHPDYWGEVDGERSSDAQPNVAHDDVQQMFVDYALDELDENPDQHSVAMDPRDGNYWSNSDESLQIGGPSEQATYLANRVAEEIVEHHGDEKYVGMYGYSHHSPPPDIDVHPNVIVSLATEYIRGGYTFEDMLDGWSERAHMIGIREYYGLWEWHHSLPGDGAHAADTEYLQETIPYFHDRGARFINAESNDTWGGYGLGYYLASRMLWDVDEADRMDEIIDDFLSKAFGPAQETMGLFYELIDGSSADPNVPDRPRPLNDDMVGQMYRLLDEARDIAGDDDEIRARIDDLILYTRYVDLYRRYNLMAADDPQIQDAFDDVVSFAWRIRDTMMAESVELVRYIDRDVRSNDNLQWGAGSERHEPADRHREGADEPFSEAEIEAILDDGMANNELLDLDFEPWEDSRQLVPAGFEADEKGEPGDHVNRGAVEAVMATDDGTLPAITASVGHIFDDRGPAQWELRDDSGAVVDHGEIVPDQQDHRFNLEAPGAGTYRFTLDNTGQGLVWDYESRGAKMTLLAGGNHELERNYYDRIYFYVPRGKDAIYLAGTLLEGRHDFVDGDGNTVDAQLIDEIQDYTVVPVPQGQDGRVWSLQLRSAKPEIRFLNIPGYVALSPDELLLPREVVDDMS